MNNKLYSRTVNKLAIFTCSIQVLLENNKVKPITRPIYKSRSREKATEIIKNDAVDHGYHTGYAQLGYDLLKYDKKRHVLRD